MGQLSDKVGTAFESDDPLGGFLHIIKPDGIGGWISYAISLTNLLKYIQGDVDAITYPTKRQDLSVAASFQFNIPENTGLLNMVMEWLSGTCLINVGTTDGGSDILLEYPITSGVENFSLYSYSTSARTIYVTRVSGTFNLTTNYLTDAL